MIERFYRAENEVRREQAMSERVMTEREFETVNYIRANWEREDKLAIVLIDRRNNGKVDQRILLAEEITSDKYQRFLRAANANGKDVFISMSALRSDARGRTKAHIGTVRHVFLDLDSGGKESVEKIVHTPNMPPPHHVLESSPGKFQTIWSVKEFDTPQAEALMRTMVPVYEADPAATDVSRVLRLPGFRNWKYQKPHYVREVEIGARASRTEYSPAEFPGFDQEQIQVSRTARWATRPGMAPGKSQSEKDFGWAIRQLKLGADRQKVVWELAAARPDKPNPVYYAQHTVDKAYARYAASAEPSNHMRRRQPETETNSPASSDFIWASKQLAAGATPDELISHLTLARKYLHDPRKHAEQVIQRAVATREADQSHGFGNTATS
jgi:hypothetical protein